MLLQGHRNCKNRNWPADINEVFVAHGFFKDTNKGTGKYDLHEHYWDEDPDGKGPLPNGKWDKGEVYVEIPPEDYDVTATVTIDNYGGGSSITVTPDDYYSPNTPRQGYMKQGTIAVSAKKAGYCNNNGYCEATEVDSCGDCVLSPVTGGATGGSGTEKFNKCEGDQPYLYVEDMIMGKTVETPIIMCNAEDLASMDLDWSYNASVLKLINVTKVIDLLDRLF